MHRFILALALIMIVQPTAAQPAPEPAVAGTVSRLFVDEASFGVLTDSPIVNPAHCPTPDSYRSQSFLIELYYATALTAFTMTAPITITIHKSECADGRPKIVRIFLDRQNAPDLSGRINTISNRWIRYRTTWI